MSTATPTGSRAAALLERTAAAPVSWGVCEVPRWGLQLPPDVVLAEMRSLGISATEAGPDGWLGAAPDAVRALLGRSGLRLVGGFLPLVLHDPARLAESLERARRTAALFAGLGARVVCTAAVVDDAWSPPAGLAAAEWEHLLRALPLVDEAVAAHGVVQALHPHWGTLIEREEAVRRVLDGSDVGVCLDTGHLALGGADPLALARSHPGRVAHVHLKDVDGALAARLRDGEIAFVDAVRAGLFRPLGAGDARVGEVVAALEAGGYAGWYVLEQDAALDGSGADADRRPLEQVRRSVEFLRRLGQRLERGAARA